MKMDWETSELNFKTRALIPIPTERFKKKFAVGLNLMLHYKNTLILENDSTFCNFLNVYEKVEPCTLLDFDRAFVLFQAVQATNRITGSTIECGVYKGGSSILIATNDPNKKHYALDTFEGFPDMTCEVDAHEEGQFSDVQFSEVQKFFMDYKNINILKGLFSDSFKKLLNEQFSFVYCDADLYRSTMECCTFFYSRLSRGGIILFDDYLIGSTRGVKKAVDEFFSRKPEFPIVLPTCQALVTKL
jgi:O-methyltransferase